MNILHVVSSLNPAAGGPPAVAIRLAAGQAILGHRVSICVYRNPEQADAIARSLQRVPSIDRIERIELPPPDRRERFTASIARKQLRSIIPDIDVIHLHGVWDPIIKAAGQAAREANKPYVICPHGMLDPWSLAQRWLKKKMALLLGYRRLLDHAAALHVLNDDEKHLIEPLRLKPTPVVIPNGIFAEELVIPSESLPISAAARGRYILFLGRLHTKKGLDILADAFAIVAERDANVSLMIVGPEGDASQDFDRRIKAAQLTDRVHRAGALYGDEKLLAYQNATCFCLPSHQEGFSLAVAEALAMGVPAVITPGVHFPEVQTAGAGRVVEPTAAAVAAALLEILTDPQLRQQMSDAGRKLIASKYTWPRIAEQSIAMYERSVRRPAV